MRTRWTTLTVVAAMTAILALVAGLVAGGSASAAPKAGFTACLVTDIGGLNDKGFNHLAYVGLQKAEKAGVKGIVEQSHSPADYIPNLKSCVQKGAGVTVAVGFLMSDAITAVAEAYPTSKFAIVDVDATTLKNKPKNVQGLLFKEQEAGYLVGYAAGLWIKAHPVDGKQVLGSVGGLKIPPVDRYIAGFQFGAKKADPGVKLLNGYSQDFVAQAKCKEQALNQIQNGAGVIFQVAGQCGLGALDAAHSKGLFGIGVDADQGYLGPWVMTSALKRVDVAVDDAILAARANKLKGGIDTVFGANKNGVGYGKWSKKVPQSIRKAVAAQYKLLKAGKIKGIPSTVK